MKQFIIQNRYQDEGWENTEKEFDEVGEADREAIKCAGDAIVYGMTRVVDTQSGFVISTYYAGFKG